MKVLANLNTFGDWIKGRKTIVIADSLNFPVVLCEIKDMTTELIEIRPSNSGLSLNFAHKKTKWMLRINKEIPDQKCYVFTRWRKIRKSRRKILSDKKKPQKGQKEWQYLNNTNSWVTLPYEFVGDIGVPPDIVPKDAFRLKIE